MSRLAKISLLSAALVLPNLSSSGTFVLAQEDFPDIRMHPRNFSGFGGDLDPIRVCMDISANQATAIQAEPALIKAIATINRFRSLGANTAALGALTDVPSGQYDFESVLLHELGHTHGLAHPNHADESGLPGAASNGTASGNGPNNMFDQSAGADGLHGSADDVRGDDQNLHWYGKAVNNPGLLPSIIDENTYARDLSFLPPGHLYAANADRQVLAALGFANAEAVMQQGALPDEAQRHFQHDDIATLRFARAGLDGIQGSSDDYRTELVYRGRSLSPQSGEACQISVRFDNSTGFASTSLGSYRHSTEQPNHWALFSTRIRFNPAVNWYFSPGPNTTTTIVSDLPDASAGLAPITVRVEVAKAAGNPIASHPLGVVEVRDGPRHLASTASCSFTLVGTPNEIGECVLTPLRTGNKILVADYLGYGGFDGGSDTETHASTGTLVFSAISNTPAPSAVVAPVALSWTLAPAVGAPAAIASGTVTVKDAVDCASPALNPAHQCTVNLPANTCTMSFASAGNKSLQFCYSGDGAHAAAAASTSHLVDVGRATTTTLTSNLPNPSVPLAPVSVQVSVRETPDLGGLPRGVVQVLDGPESDPLTARCSISLSGTAAEIGSCTLKPLRAGSRNLSASFAAQGIWAASAGAASQSVADFAIVRNQPSSARVGQGVHVTVNVDVASYLGTPAPTGTITVSDGVDQCQIVLPASTCFWFGSTSGTRNLVASWPGNANYPPRTSAAVVQTVLPPSLPQLISVPIAGAADSNGLSTAAALGLSADGRFAVFSSLASDLVGGDSNGALDVFIRDQRSGHVRRVSTSASGVQANGPSREPAISANGRFVAFTSLASNLVAGDTNNVVDVFVKDLSDGSIVRANLRANGQEDTATNLCCNGFDLLAPSLSADGRFIAFMTGGQLSPLDTSFHNDIYVRDLQTGALDIVSSNSNDVLGDFRSMGPAVISADGRYVAFASQAFNFAPNDNNDTQDIWRKDRLTRRLDFVSSNATGQGGFDTSDVSYGTAMSADGRYVVFSSLSEHLVPNDVNNDYDVFLKDVLTGAIERISTTSTGVNVGNRSDSPGISADGRYVVFRSSSNGLVAGDTNGVSDIFVRDRQLSTVSRINLNPNGTQTASGDSVLPAISADGRFVSYQSAASTLVTGDTNAADDVFVRDILTPGASSVRASAVNPGARVDSASSDASISRDGSVIAFASAASNLINGDTNGVSDIFVRIPASNTTTRVSVGSLGQVANAASDSPSLSGNGVWLAFRSSANNLFTGDANNVADIFVKNRLTEALERVSSSSAGVALAGNVLRPGTAISDDGLMVLFHAADNNLTTGDNNGREDVFLRNRNANTTTLVSSSASSALANGNNVNGQISGDATRAVFASDATNLVLGDSNALRDIYVKNLLDNSIQRASFGVAGSEPNGASDFPSISSNGRLVAFSSAASNLVSADTNAAIDVFVVDLHAGSVQRVSTNAAGEEGTGGDCNGPTSLSADGRYVGFSCTMSNLVPGDSNALADSFVKDLITGAITRTSLTSTLAQANAATVSGARALSGSGMMAFSSAATNLIPVHEFEAHSDVFLSTFSTTPQLATTTVITSHTPNPSPRNGSYLVSVSVTRSSGSADVRGSVLISEGPNTCFAILSGSGASASGQCALQGLSAGPKTIAAVYGGDQQYASSTATSVNHTVLPIVPFAPTIGTARAGNGEVLVYFSAPSDDGGSAILSYTATCGGRSALGQSAPITVNGLSNGVAVSCTVVATNAVGTGAASAASNSVTPSASQSAVGPFAYIPRFNTGQMAMLDLGRDQVIAEISGGAGIGIAVAPNGLRAYAIDQASSSVRVINAVSRTLLTSIPVGSGPWSGVVSPDSARLYVSNRNAGTVSVIDTANNSVLSSFNVAAAPTGLVISPDGSKLFVGSANTTNLSVVALPSQLVTQFDVGTTTQALAISPDGSRVYFANGQPTGRMLAFNTATNTIAGSVNVGGVPLAINISADGSRIYVSNNGGNGNLNGNTVSQIDAATLTVIATGATGPRPLGVDVHPDGSRVYVGNNNGTLSVLNTNGMSPVATINLGSSDAIYAIGNFIARASRPSLSRKLAVGAITLPATGTNNTATRVIFPQPFSATPVVIVQPSNADTDPKALRLANITGSGFDVLQVEPRGCVGCTGAGGAMTVHWLAALPGSYRLPNDVPNRLHSIPQRAPGAGVIVKVGSVLTMANQRATSLGGFAGFAMPSWQTVSFPSAAGDDFSAPPVVLTSIQSWNPANAGSNFSLPGLPGRPALNGVSRLWFTPAVSNVSSTGFEAALESSSSDNSGAANPGLFNAETIGYIAFENNVSTNLAVIGETLVPFATGIGSASSLSTCPQTDLSFPRGTVITPANLRGFAGLHTRNEDDGGWVRSCGFSTPIGADFSHRLRIDEDEDLSPDRSHLTPETIGTAVFGGDFSTTPVSLAFVTVQRRGAQLEVEFGSATEAGHLGYRIWGRSNSSSDWQALHEDLILSKTGDSMSGQRYQRTLNAEENISQIRLEDVDVLGASRFHAALSLDGEGRASMGAPAQDQALDWSAIRASNAASPVRALRGSGSASVLASVRKYGIQRASYAELLAAGLPADVLVGALAVLENGQPVARYIECNSAQFGPGCFVEWLGQPRTSLYGSERIYQIIQNPAAVRRVSTGAVVASASALRTHAAEIQQFPNRLYSFSAPGNDPWFDQRLAANSAPVSLSRSFSLPARVAGPVQLSVDLWGGLDFSGAQNSAPDHSVELLLNGTTIARERFDGLVLKRISQRVDEALLLPVNTLTLRLSADTGYSADVVLLDGFKVSYPRSSTLSEGELRFGEFTTTSTGDDFFSDGFETGGGFAVQGVNTASIVWSQRDGRILRDVIAGPVALDQRITALQISAATSLQTPVLSPAAPGQIDLAPVDYLIVTHPLFESELQPIISLQQSRGYSVKVLRTDAIYAANSAHQRSPQAIREAIAQINPRFVLLIGGDSYDYDDNLGAGSQSYLPTFYRVSNAIVRFAASDAPFVDHNGDGLPERALGRIPARTVEELRRAIAAIVQRGNTPAQRFFASAGGSNATEHFDVHSHALLSYLRQNQSVDYGLSDEIGISEARIKATAALAGGSDWINYLGHSSPNRWAAQNLLDTTQLANVQRTGLPAIVSQWGCWNSYFVLPNQDTMSHALMLRSNQLAAAVIGSSSLAEDASHLALGTRFFDLIEDGRIDDRGGVAINTLGEALQAAKADLATHAPEHLESNYSITLFGDPAMRLR